MTKRREDIWVQWHKKGIPLNHIRTPENGLEQYKSILDITNIKQTKKCKVLEIGPSDGYLSKEILSNLDISNYTLVDDKRMLELCKTNLIDFKQVDYVTIEELDSIKKSHYDIFISNNCLEETTDEYLEEVCLDIFPYVQEIFILTNLAHSSLFGQINIEMLVKHLYLNFSNVSVLPGQRAGSEMHYSLNRSSQRIYYANK